MRSTLFILIITFILPSISISTEYNLIQVCKRVEGCITFPTALTEKEYCPTCVYDKIKINNLSTIKYKSKVTHKAKSKHLFDCDICFAQYEVRNRR